MKNSLKLMAMLLGITLFLSACDPMERDESPIAPSLVELDTYIITLNNSGNSTLASTIDSKINEVISSHGIERSSVTFVYDKALFGFAARLTESQLNSLKTDKNIIDIEKDQVYELSDNNTIGTNPTIQAQTTAWGITAVGGSVNATASTGIAWIIDTGIDLTHADLNVNSTLSRTFVTSGSDALSPNDLHGHGSHVAGIVAAKNNNIGSIGVCANAELVAVKVMNYRGSGTTSQIIAGINYVAGNMVNGRINVVNMSLGGTASTAMDNAVISLANAGAYVVIAAGNSAKSATTVSPARVNGTRIFTISAFDALGRLASFSNFGNPPIDYSAPGVSIYSTTKNGGYATMSGTSMAAPHVAGILLANNGTINWSGRITNDKDSSPDMKAVR